MRARSACVVRWAPLAARSLAFAPEQNDALHERRTSDARGGARGARARGEQQRGRRPARWCVCQHVHCSLSSRRALTRAPLAQPCAARRCRAPSPARACRRRLRSAQRRRLLLAGCTPAPWWLPVRTPAGQRVPRRDGQLQRARGAGRAHSGRPPLPGQPADGLSCRLAAEPLVAVVTGASRGIGRAIAVALAAAGCKARVPRQAAGPAVRV